MGWIKGDGVGVRARILVGGSFWEAIKKECKGAEKVPRKEGREVRRGDATSGRSEILGRREELC